jgi:hypothetical protein
MANEADRMRPNAEIRQLKTENIRAALNATSGKVVGRGNTAGLLWMKPTTLATA